MNNMSQTNLPLELQSLGCFIQQTWSKQLKTRFGRNSWVILIFWVTGTKCAEPTSVLHKFQANLHLWFGCLLLVLISWLNVSLPVSLDSPVLLVQKFQKMWVSHNLIQTKSGLQGLNIITTREHNCLQNLDMALDFWSRKCNN